MTREVDMFICMGFIGHCALWFLEGACTLDTKATKPCQGLFKTQLKKSLKPQRFRSPSSRVVLSASNKETLPVEAENVGSGWYFKVSIPERKQNFCIIYTVENPAFQKKLSGLEVAQNGPRSTGVGAQILGADDKFIFQHSEESQNFWGSRHELMLGNTFVVQKDKQPPTKEVPPQEFNGRVLEGFQVSPFWHQGFIRDNGRTDYVKTVKTARWEYSTRPIYGWGNVGSKQKATAGWIEWEGERIEFKDAPSYSEKNWGGAFPRKWFWLQCNVFEGASGEVALTAAGGLRQLPGPADSQIYENAALIGVHFDGTFHEFVPWNGVVNWEISPWGYWYLTAENETHLVELEARAKELGTPILVPTVEAGLAPACMDTCSGVLKLQMWERRQDGTRGKAFPSDGVVSTIPSNLDRTHVKHWSMLCGKECTMHIRACFAGGSLEAL
ncbi:unnamed protein product [Dovyalis caffra]|uniref:Tocopherol cyclase n=1 Tax=Dovyalis caffra TaxID=77055 RepID=A0AAV1SK86_9ROSI|nr:unnamed protein product [Dovyalis caffra]